MDWKFHFDATVNVKPSPNRSIIEDDSNDDGSDGEDDNDNDDKDKWKLTHK
jgi:hypothetical protein